MADTTNVKIGACSVTFDGTDLGHTKGGCTLKYSPEYQDITVDQYGNTVLDKALVGETMTITVPLAESQLLNLSKIIPLGTLAGAGNKRLNIGKNAGARLLSLAKQLVLHPSVNDATNRDEDVVFYKAIVHNEIEVPYKVDEERVIEVEFLALVDTSKANGSWLGHVGDSAV